MNETKFVSVDYCQEMKYSVYFILLIFFSNPGSETNQQILNNEELISELSLKRIGAHSQKVEHYFIGLFIP